MDKWLMFKNYMHNEIGVTKDDIRAWIKEAVDDVAKKLVEQTFEYFSIEKRVDKYIEKEVIAWGNRLKKNVQEAVGEVIAKRLEVKVKEKNTLLNGYQPIDTNQENVVPPKGGTGEVKKC